MKESLLSRYDTILRPPIYIQIIAVFVRVYDECDLVVNYTHRKEPMGWLINKKKVPAGAVISGTSSAIQSFDFDISNILL